MKNELICENQILKLRCPNGHIVRLSFKEFENGDRCPMCNQNKEGGEKKK